MPGMRCAGGSDSPHGWCSLRLRFEVVELDRLRAAEQARGRVLVEERDVESLYAAVSLAQAGLKLRAATPGSQVVLSEDEVRSLRDAARHADERELSASR